MGLTSATRRIPAAEFPVSSARALVLGRFRLADLADQPLDESIGRLAFGLRLEIGANAMPEDRCGHLAHVVERDAEAAVHGGHGLAGQDQVLAGPRAGAVIDQLLDEPW